MTELERNEISTRTKAMPEEEMIVVLKNMPGNLMIQELERRYSEAIGLIQNVRGVVHG